MRLHPRRFLPWVASAALACSALVQASPDGTAIGDPMAFMARAEALRTADHPRFVQMLEQLHHDTPPMSKEAQWRLRYLDAWETMFQGDYAKSEDALRQVVEHSGDTTLSAKAAALLLSNLGINRRYEEAFALANRLVGELNDIKDTQARNAVLINLSQMFNLAGQTDLAIQYAHMVEESAPAGDGLCRAISVQTAALFSGKRLSSGSAEIQRAVDVCSAAGQPVMVNAMLLTQSSLLLLENHPEKAMALLERISTSIETSRYYPHLWSLRVQRAQANEALGNDGEARKAALAAVAMSKPDDVSEWLKEAYEVLYRVEKRRGNGALALSYYEQFVTQDKGYLDDISARTLAYEVVQQHTLVQKLTTESLSKQNNILLLQQALDTKAVETSRLYIAFLLLALVSIGLWLVRIKRSQLRFKHLSRLDGLTGILNHQHFISEADRALRSVEKGSGSACLVSIDMDYFKLVNDTHGHAMGDQVLRRTVAICQQHLRSNDVFGRLGGEEFCIFLLDCTRDRGMVIANRIRMAIEATPVTGEGITVSYSASIGLACTDACGYDLQRLCRDADTALYRAKRMGRNCVVADTGHVALMGTLAESPGA